jgi:hypothetical protein
MSLIGILPFPLLPPSIRNKADEAYAADDG